jgi:hypothetical protein
MQAFHRCGLAPERDAIGAELITLSGRHGQPAAEVLGHLIRLQSQCALGHFDAAAIHARAADELAARHELPLVAVFTRWFRASRSGPDAAGAYLAAASTLDRAGMPGLTEGLLPLALLTLGGTPADDQDYGPYEPWVRGRAGLPDPPADPMAEVLWCLAARAAVRNDDRRTAERARDALRPAAGEHAANGLLAMGPIRDHLAGLDRYLDV